MADEFEYSFTVLREAMPTTVLCGDGATPLGRSQTQSVCSTAVT
jgi:hypothetical protein